MPVAATLLGAAFVAGAMPGAQQPALVDVLHDAAAAPTTSLGLWVALCAGTRTFLAHRSNSNQVHWGSGSRRS